MDSARICLTHGSADKLLERCAVTGVELEPCDLCPQDFRADTAFASDVLANQHGATKDWLNLLVGRQCDRRDSSTVSSHCYEGRVSPGSILHYGEGVYVASPNFNLLLQSADLHVVQLAQLLGRYWGTFSTEVDKDGFLLERAPLTSEVELSHYLAGIRGVHGVGNLRSALKYTCEHAASPQEVNLQLILCLPYACNGFALPKPQMNHRIDLEREERAFYDASHIRIDLYWPKARFGLEYLGEKEHRGRMIEDVSRWYAAHKGKVELWPVTKAQLQDPVAMNFIARKVATRVHRKPSESAWPTLDETELLIGVLFGGAMPNSNKKLRVRPIRSHGLTD